MKEEEQVITEYFVRGVDVLGGKPHILRERTVDLGPAGKSRVVVLDPCISEEAQQRRREAIVAKCEDLIRRGLM